VHEVEYALNINKSNEYTTCGREVWYCEQGKPKHAHKTWLNQNIHIINYTAHASSEQYCYEIGKYLHYNMAMSLFVCEHAYTDFNETKITIHSNTMTNINTNNKT